VEYSEGMRRRYVQMERSPVLSRLAEEATQGARGPHDKAEAIRKFVSERCSYTLEARRVPDDRDAVDFFLNDSKEGYCDLYASAVAVLARHVGLPSRVATGFSQGEPDQEAPGAFLIRESHRHAWPEIYFEGYGWRPYDPTETTIAAGSGDRSQAGRRASWFDRLKTFLLGPGGLITVGGIAFLGAIAWTFGSPSAKGKATGEERWSPVALRVAAVHRRCARDLSRRGVPRQDSETLGEHASRVRHRFGSEIGDPFARIVAVLEDVLYARRDPDPSVLGSVEEAAEAMRRAMANRGRDGA